MTRNRTNNPYNPHVNKHPRTSSNYPYASQNITVTRNLNPTTAEQTTTSTQTNENTIDNSVNKKLKNLKIISWNANGLTNKRGELRTLIEDENPDIVAICEAKMDSVSVNLLHEFNEIGFYPYHKLRNKDGGGVVLLVKKTIKNCKEIVLSKDEEAIYGLNELEMIGVQIKLENKHYNIVCNYVPPEKKVSKKLFDYLEKNGNYILVGDFNAKLASYNNKTNASGNKLQEILDEANCHVINERYQPT
jgi:exonuclease III